jgi:hypothetical protein
VAVTALPVVVVEREIAAAPQRIFDVLADPARHPEIDGSGTVQRARDGNPERLTLGATFGMAMRIGAPYRVTNRVIEFEEAGRIAWRHVGGHVWRYVLTPTAAGTLVREEWDPNAAPLPVRWFLRLSRFSRRNRAGMTATLERLERLVAAG